LIGLVGPPTLLCASAGAALTARIVIAMGRQVLRFIRRSLSYETMDEIAARPEWINAQLVV
jgi:hypothetical protein